MYATFVCTIHYCTDDATSHYLLLFPAKIVHTVFNMVLTEHAEEDEIAVPLCLMITCNATFKWTANNTKFVFNEEMYIGLTILYLAKRPLS